MGEVIGKIARIETFSEIFKHRVTIFTEKLVRCRFCLFQNSQKMRRNLHLISSFFANILIFEAPNAKH